MHTGILAKAETRHELTLEETILLLGDATPEADLFAAADRVREKYVGSDVHLRGLIEFSNYCAMDCHYCGLRRSNRNVDRYRLDTGEILALATRAKQLGYMTLVLQSGEDRHYTAPLMSEIIAAIKPLDLALTLSIGERPTDDYAAMRDAGADRFLLRIETTDPGLYAKFHPGMDLHNRIRCLRDIKHLGYETGTGSLIGLPGQTDEMIARDIHFYREIGADMIGIGPLIPNEDTPLGAAPGGFFTKSIRAMAITRLLLPDINIPATTAMETLHPRGRLIALESGANVVMPNVTDTHHRNRYILYPGKICLSDTTDKCRGCITAKIQSIGRTIGAGYGHSRSTARP